MSLTKKKDNQFILLLPQVSSNESLLILCPQPPLSLPLKEQTNKTSFQPKPFFTFHIPIQNWSSFDITRSITTFDKKTRQKKWTWTLSFNEKESSIIPLNVQIRMQICLFE